MYKVHNKGIYKKKCMVIINRYDAESQYINEYSMNNNSDEAWTDCVGHKEKHGSVNDSLVSEGALSDSEFHDPCNESSELMTEESINCALDSNKSSDSEDESRQVGKESAKRKNTHTCQLSAKKMKHIKTETTKCQMSVNKFRECGTFKGSPCKYQCAQESNLACHMCIHTGKKTYTCDQCQFSTSQEGSLTWHNKHVHEICGKECGLPDTDFINDDSDKLYPTKEEYPSNINETKSETSCTKSEAMTILNNFMVEPEVEGKTAASEGNLPASAVAALPDFRRVPSKNIPKPHICEYCDFATNRRSHLVRHMRIHTGETPYRCKFCDYVGKQPIDLTRHIMRHTGEKPFKCSMCDYECSQKSNLTRHVRIHTGEKPYKCDVCRFFTSQKGSLLRHMRSHQSGKSYKLKCEFCEYVTNSDSHLSKHVKSHSDPNLNLEKMSRFEDTAVANDDDGYDEVDDQVDLSLMKSRNNIDNDD